jgi:hypothetical protein
VRIAQRDRQHPGHRRVALQRLHTLPADVVAGLADAEHRIQQQLHRAAARSDDQVGAGDGLGEAVAQIVAQPLHRQQQETRQRHRDQHQPQPEAAVPGAAPGDGQQQGRLHAAAASTTGCPVQQGQLGHPIEMRCQPGVVADEEQGAVGGPAGRDQQVHEGVAARFVQRGGGFVRNHQLRPAQQGAGGGHPLLLAHRQPAGRAAPQRLGQVQPRQQAAGAVAALGRGRPGALRAQGREAAGQQHVVQHAEIGQQVELLEHDADVVGAPPVAPSGRQIAPILAQQADLTGVGRQHPGSQGQQRGLAAAAGAAQQQALAGDQLQRGQVQHVLRGAGPAEVHLPQAEDGQRGLGRVR